MKPLDRQKWKKLNGDERNLLLAIIAIFMGSHVSLDKFAATMHSLLTDYPGREILSEAKRCEFVNELWREYEWRRKKRDHKNRFHK